MSRHTFRSGRESITNLVQDPQEEERAEKKAGYVKRTVRLNRYDTVKFNAGLATVVFGGLKKDSSSLVNPFKTRQEDVVEDVQHSVQMSDLVSYDVDT